MTTTRAKVIITTKKTKYETSFLAIIVAIFRHLWQKY